MKFIQKILDVPSFFWVKIQKVMRQSSALSSSNIKKFQRPLLLGKMPLAMEVVEEGVLGKKVLVAPSKVGLKNPLKHQ
jgi:hypothetical protein